MYRENDKLVNKHYIYLDSNEDSILLPNIFSRYTQCAQYKIESYSGRRANQRRFKQYLVETEIGEGVAYKICNHLGRFLEWIERYKDCRLVSLDNHSALPSEIINEYINEYLIVECNKSEFVANQAVNALKAYYCWLSYYFENNFKHIGIKPSFREIARNNSKKSLTINYLLPATRELLYSVTDNLLKEIILRNGGQLGCRTKENQGFLLNDFIANKRKHAGLLTLFNRLSTKPYQNEFKYHLSSLYTKYGRARTLYIPRHLLKKMKEYYETERPKSDSNHLLVSNANNNRGQCLSKSYACRVFFDTKEKLKQKIKENQIVYRNIQEIHDSYSYHVLRHSFGTDLFYDLCEGQNKLHETITTTSAVYLETARRLGHKVDGRHSPVVTKSYIRSCGYREILLKEVVGGI